MTTATERFEVRPPVRFAGLLYLINIAGCATAELAVRSKLIVWGDPVVTTNNIAANEQLLRYGIVSELVAVIAFVTAAAIFYEMFKPVSRTLSLLAALFAAVEAGVHSVALINQLTPAVILDSGRLLGAFLPAQIQQLVLFFLRLRALSFDFCMVFFGCYFLTLGILAYRSTFLPRLLGVLLMLAGIGPLGIGFGHILGVHLAGPAYIMLIVPFGVGRLILGLWLVIRGINRARWEALVRAPA